MANTIPAEVVDHTATSLSSQTTPTSAGDKEATVGLPDAQPVRSGGSFLRRWRWWLAGAVLLACVIVGAVVGGVVGSRNAHHSSSSTTTTSTWQLDTPLSASLRAVSASTTAGDASEAATLQVFYQDLNTSNILYRLVWEDDALTEQTADLTVEPRSGTPLTVVGVNSSTDDSAIVLNLFYLTDDSAMSNGTAIVQATLDCTAGAASCSTTYNAIISGNVTTGPRFDSGLSAVQLDGDADQEFRVFYHADTSQPALLSGSLPLANGWSTTSAGGSMTPDNSSISTNKAAGDDNGIDLFFVNSNSGDPRQEQYYDDNGISGSKTNRTTITDTDGAGFYTTAKFTSAYCTDLATYYFYYVKTDGSIGAWSRNTASNDTWVQYSDDNWSTSDGDITAVTWGDQVRLIYMSGGELVVSVDDNDVWASVTSL